MSLPEVFSLAPQHRRTETRSGRCLIAVKGCHKHTAALTTQVKVHTSPTQRHFDDGCMACTIYCCTLSLINSYHCHWEYMGSVLIGQSSGFTDHFWLTLLWQWAAKGQTELGCTMCITPNCACMQAYIPKNVMLDSNPAPSIRPTHCINYNFTLALIQNGLQAPTIPMWCNDKLFVWGVYAVDDVMSNSGGGYS